MATDDDPIHWFDVPAPSPAGQREALRAQLAGVELAENHYAAEVAWSTVRRRFSQVGIATTAWGFMSSGRWLDAAGAAMADAGLALSSAQLYMDLVQAEDPGPAGLAFLKDVSLWAVGRFGWASLGVASGVIGIGDYLLGEVGEGGVSARQTPVRIAFENYFGSTALIDEADRSGSPGYLTDDEWMRLFLVDEVRDLESALSSIRGHLSRFWDLPDADKQEYGMPERAYHEVGAFGEAWLRVVGHDRTFHTHGPEDIKAIEDDYIRKVMLPRLRHYFEVVLPVQLRIAAQERTAEQLDRVREMLNATCMVRLDVRGLPEDTHRLVAVMGIWRGAFEPTAGRKDLRFTRYAWLSQQPEAPPEIMVGRLARDGTSRILTVPITHPLEWGACRQEVVVDFAGAPVEEPAQVQPEQRESPCVRACPPGERGSECRERCACHARCDGMHDGMVGAGIEAHRLTCRAACGRPAVTVEPEPEGNIDCSRCWAESDGPGFSPQGGPWDDVLRANIRLVVEKCCIDCCRAGGGRPPYSPEARVDGARLRVCLSACEAPLR